MEEKNVEHIDFKRLVVNKSEENTWMKHLHQNIGKLKASFESNGVQSSLSP